MSSEVPDELVARLLRSHGRRLLLKTIAELGVTTSSELVRRTGLRRQTVNEYLVEFEEGGLVKLRRDQRPWVVIFPEELKDNAIIKSLLTEREEEKKKKIKFRYSWSDFPECLLSSEGLDLCFVWGSGPLVKAKAHDALHTPEMVKELIFYALDRGVREPRIAISSMMDSDVLSHDTIERNLFVIGSGVVNAVTAEIMRIYDLPIRFEPPMGREIYSQITQRVYAAGEPPSSNAAIVALLPNPWNEERVVILAAGIFRHGTMAAVNAVYSHILHQRGRGGQSLTPHPLANIPIRVVRASPKGEVEGFFE